MSSQPGRLDVGVISAGRVGAVLASALRSVGHHVVGAAANSQESRTRAEELLAGVPILDPVEVARRADLVVLAVPDDALTALVRWIDRQGGFRPGQLVVHTSGRFGTEVLADAQRSGAIGLAIHPAMTFTGTSLDLARLVETPFGVTAPAAVLPIAQALVVELGGEPVVIPEASRGAYHAALAHASNHLVTLVSGAQQILTSADVVGQNPDTPARLLGPLTRAALEGALTRGGAALTGPVSRGDAGTLSDHLAVLDEQAARHGDELRVAETYRELARATVELARGQARIDDESAAKLHRRLAVPATPRRPASTIEVVTSIPRLRELRRLMVGTVAVVPTMGALHEGHLELVRAARTAADHVIVTIFVNPTQFGDPGDLAAYPRQLDSDLAALEALGPDAPEAVFAPTAAELYPRGSSMVTLDPGPLGSEWEGAARPGHYSGVLTVVAKLFHLTQPDVGVFGEKDAQQVALVRAMVADLDLPLWILTVPVVRESDGLAMSSRNIRLSPADRKRALGLSRSVFAAQRFAAAGAAAEQIVAAARAELDDIELDYAVVVDEESFGRLTEQTRVGRYLVAGIVGGVRLLDTGRVDILGE